MAIDALANADRPGLLVEMIRFYTRASLLIVDEIVHLPIGQGGVNPFLQLVKALPEKGAFAIALEPMATRSLAPHFPHFRPRLRRTGRGLRRARRRHRG